MFNAYDIVKWPDFEVVMKAFGFKEQWIGLIMSSVSTINYSILANGKPHNRFVLSRGLRQRDPLSSYLFLMYS